MDITIERSEFVTIEGLTEAAVASSDAQLVLIVEYADRASRFLSEADKADDNSPMHSVLQIREAALTELTRRRGNCFDYSGELHATKRALVHGQGLLAC